MYKIYYDAKRNAEPINYINPYYLEKLEKFGIDYDQLYEDEGINQIKESLLNDLNRLTRCLEIYLSKSIENTGIKYKLNHIDGLRIDHVLSFNYTHTFERVYGEYKRIQYDYIHGEAKEFGDIEECNLILGIDEYLDDLQRDKDTQFIELKKFYQRIYKRTGCNYVDWIDEVEKSSRVSSIGYDSLNQVYIIGHSLDITDGDVIRGLITMPNTRTIIYYHNKEALGRYISNLVRILGENQLIAMSYGKNAKVIFKEQNELF